MRIKAELMDEEAVRRSLRRMAHEIDERESQAEGYVLLGIRRRGVPLARMLAEALEQISQKPVALGHLDISFYRDDLTHSAAQPQVSETRMPKTGTRNQLVILVDDVIYTGRTARAAMEAVISQGRPAAIRLAVLIDRGHREMPIRPDFVGKNVPTSKRETIRVEVPEFEDRLRVLLVERPEGAADEEVQ